MIRRKVILTLLLSGVLSSLWAQSSKDTLSKAPPSVATRIAIHDTSNNGFFKRHPEIERISIGRKDATLHYLFVYFKSENKKATERAYYELTFEGDKMLFKDIYGTLDIRVAELKLQLEQDGAYTPIPHSNTCYISITPDTVKYHFPVFNDWNRIQLGTLAKYDGNVDELNSGLTEEYAGNTNLGTVPDSSLLFRAVVPKYVSPLQDVELILGKQSPFSNWVKKRLSSDRYSWYPAMLSSRGPVPSYLRVLVRLHPDGTITVTSPTTMRDLLGAVIIPSQSDKKM